MEFVLAADAPYGVWWVVWLWLAFLFVPLLVVLARRHPHRPELVTALVVVSIGVGAGLLGIAVQCNSLIASNRCDSRTTTVVGWMLIGVEIVVYIAVAVLAIKERRKAGGPGAGDAGTLAGHQQAP